MVNWRISNKVDNTMYDILALDSITFSVDSGLINIPLPMSDAGDTMLMKYAGLVEHITLVFKLVLSSTDLSGGTEPSGIYTVTEQRDFLREHFITSNMPPTGFPAEFHLQEFGGTYSVYGDVAKLSIDYKTIDVGQVATVTIEFEVGTGA